jgi:hypothetical protein
VLGCYKLIRKQLGSYENNPDNDPWPEKQRDEEMKEMVGATPIQN